MAIKNPMGEPFVVAAFVMLGIHGACYFRIRHLLRKAGNSINLVTDIGDAISQYRQYYREAPARNWPLWPIYLSIISLMTMFGALLLFWITHRHP